MSTGNDIRSSRHQRNSYQLSLKTPKYTQMKRTFMDINFLLTFTPPYSKKWLLLVKLFYLFFLFFPNVEVYFQRTYRYLVLRAWHVEARQGAGIWCLRLSPCLAFDRAKRPRGRDIWLWPTEAWYQFRSGYQVRPSRLSESHAIGESYEVTNVYFEKGFIFKFPSDCKTRLKSNSTMKVRGFFMDHWSDLFRHVEQMLLFMLLFH